MGYTPGSISNAMGSWLDKLLYGGNLGVQPGDWSVNGLRLPEFGVTEAFASEPTYDVPGTDPDTSGGQILGLNTDQEINWNGTPTPTPTPTGTPTSTPTGSPTTSPDLEAILARQRARNSSLIDSWLGQAGGMRDEVKGMTQKKRGQYADMRNEGDVKINDTFETEKGNARRTANDLGAIEGNRARALGLGGSATDYAASRRGEQLGRTLGNTNTVKSENTMENKRLYDTRIDQADAWDRQADRDYQTAGLKAQDAKNSMLNTEEGTLMGWLGNILNNQLALNATKSSINSEVANPYAVDTSKIANYLTSSLTGGVDQNGKTNGSNEGVNLTTPNMLALAKDPRKYKSLLYGANA